MQGRNLLATVGGDAASPDGAQLRLWDPAIILNSSGSSGGGGGAAAAAPDAATAHGGIAAPAPGPKLTEVSPTGHVRLFPAKQPPGGSVTVFAASDAAWPQLHLAVGMSSGGIQLMRGDAGG